MDVEGVCGGSVSYADCGKMAALLTADTPEPYQLAEARV